jgi:hypothetical protein
VVVPEPFGGGGGAFDPADFVGTHGFRLLIAVQAGQSLREAAAQDEYVALLERDALFLCDCFNFVDRDAVRGEGVEFLALFVGPEFVVDEDAACNQTASLMPIYARQLGVSGQNGGKQTIQSRKLHLPILLAKILREHLHLPLQTIIVLPGTLVGIMDERVPLGGALGVELELRQSQFTGF